MTRGRALAVSTWIALSSPAQAAGATEDGAGPQRDSSLAQRELLVRRLLRDSAPVVNAGTSDVAKRRLEDARVFHDQALSALQASDFVAVEDFLNSAMKALQEARKAAAPQAKPASALRGRYGQLRASVASLAASYRGHLLRVRSHSDSAAARVDELLAEAATLAGADRLDEATRVLASAESVVMGALNQILGSATLEYAQKFETPAEEFGHELERNRSYGDLVPIALAELKPGPEARAKVASHVEDNRLQREQARLAAERGDYELALKNIRSGTETLQRALRAAGLTVPQE